MSVKLDQQALLLSRPVFFFMILFFYLFIYFFHYFFLNICIFFHSLPTIMTAHIIELISLQTLMSVRQIFWVSSIGTSVFQS